jgi:hypothetical protein
MLILTASGASGSVAILKIRHRKSKRTAAVAGLASSQRVRMKMPGRVSVVPALKKNTTKRTVAKRPWRTLGIPVTATMRATADK